MKHPEVENIKAAYEVADENGKKMLSALYPDVFTQSAEADNRPVTERIKTFEDACNALGNHPFVNHYRYIVEDSEKQMDETGSDIVSYLKLRIVVAALNEGWAPDWGNKNQRKWYPYFYILSEKEYEDLDKEEKCRVVGRSSNSANANGGLVYANAYYVSTGSYTGSGSRLAFKSKELAEYCGRQFGELWAAFHIG